MSSKAQNKTGLARFLFKGTCWLRWVYIRDRTINHVFSFFFLFSLSPTDIDSLVWRIILLVSSPKRGTNLHLNAVSGEEATESPRWKWWLSILERGAFRGFRESASGSSNEAAPSNNYAKWGENWKKAVCVAPFLFFPTKHSKVGSFIWILFFFIQRRRVSKNEEKRCPQIFLSDFFLRLFFDDKSACRRVFFAEACRQNFTFSIIKKGDKIHRKKESCFF